MYKTHLARVLCGSVQLVELRIRAILEIEAQGSLGAIREAGQSGEVLQPMGLPDGSWKLGLTKA